MSVVLVTGIAGNLARLTALELRRRGHEVVGVDYRTKPTDFPRSIEYYRGSYNKTGIADVFRRHHPDVVMHMGRVGSLRVKSAHRFDLNVVGSAKIQELSLKHKVSRLVVLSTFHIYGAHPHNHIPIMEDEPLRALQTVPQLSDVIQLDNQALQWTYRYRRPKTVILRPVSVIGPHINNTISHYLRQKNVLYISGFNPMWQFIHESDMLRALLHAAEGEAAGCFNVAGRDSLPFVEALRLTEARIVPIPGPVAGAYQRLRAASRPWLPEYMVDFIKYPCVVSDEKFRREFGFEPRVGVVDAIRSCVRRMPVDTGLE